MLNFILIALAWRTGTPPDAPVFALKPPARAVTTLKPNEREEIRGIAARLLKAADSGRLNLLNRDRERLLLHSLTELDLGTTPRLGLPLLRALEMLATASSLAKPLKVISLYRPLCETRPNEPHGNGQAVDIAAFGGYELRSENAVNCERAVLAVIDALGEGSYRLGLPTPLHAEPIPFLPPPDRRLDWPFFPPPLAAVHEEFGFVLPRLEKDLKIPTTLRPVILNWANARYASRLDIQSPAVRNAMDSACVRGVLIHSLFPDGKNHLHLDTKPSP